MIVITVIDDNMGMMFNNRRQSQDCILREQILALAGSGRLWMNHYTYRQFLNCDSASITVDDAFLAKAGAGEYCFVENVSPACYEKHICSGYLFFLFPCRLHTSLILRFISLLFFICGYRVFRLRFLFSGFSDSLPVQLIM